MIHAAHPVPDAAGEHAAQRMLALVQNLGPQDVVLCLISGGGSALLPLALVGLTLAVARKSLPGVYALAADTDGVDGQEEVAGALIGPHTLERAWAQGMNPRQYLDNNGHRFFEALGDSVITGPTLTHVNDFRAMVIAAS